jgi:putative salt-induced outer membrane protein YdiY
MGKIGNTWNRPIGAAISAAGGLCTMRLLPILLFVLLVTTRARSDEVIMVGGDVLHGRIVAMNEDVIVLTHDVVGRVRIPQSGVASFTRDHPDEQLAELDPTLAAQVSPTDSSPEPAPPVVPIDPNAGTWKSSLDVGLDIETGNTDESKLNVGFETGITSQLARAKIEGRYYYKISDSETSDNKLNIAATRDWLNLDSKWFTFVQGVYDFDQFESWRHRASTHGGPGYHLVKTEDYFLNVRGGAGIRKEWGSDNDSVKFEGLASLNFEWNITDRQHLRLSGTIFPVLDNFSDVRSREVLSWRYQLDNDSPLNLTVRLIHEYQSKVDPGKDKNDTRFLIGLSLDF